MGRAGCRVLGLPLGLDSMENRHLRERRTKANAVGKSTVLWSASLAMYFLRIKPAVFLTCIRASLSFGVAALVRCGIRFVWGERRGSWDLKGTFIRHLERGVDPISPFDSNANA